MLKPIHYGICLLALAAAVPAHGEVVVRAKPAAVTDWKIAPNDAKEFHGDGIRWAVHSLDVRAGTDVAFELSIRTADFPLYRQTFTTKDPNVQFVYGRFDPALSGPQLIVSTYSGGEYCCASRTVIALHSDGWQAQPFPAGAYDADLTFPQDIDGDGVPDFVLGDERFAYAFDDFAASWLPPRIFFLHNGTLEEETVLPRFAALVRRDKAVAGDACAKHSRGACAGYVADAIRLGELEAGWRFMLDHFCDDGEKCSDAYPKALAKFLVKNGYLRQPQADALPN